MLAREGWDEILGARSKGTPVSESVGSGARADMLRWEVIEGRKVLRKVKVRLNIKLGIQSRVEASGRRSKVPLRED